MKTREQKWVLSVETSLLKHSQEWNLPWELPRHGDNAWEYYLPLILRETPTNQTSIVVVAQSPSCVWFFATPWTTACQAPLSFMVSWNLLKLTSTESVMPSNHLILCQSPSPPAFNLSQHQGLFQWEGSSYQVAKYWSFSLNNSPSNEYSGLISFRIDRFDPLAFQRTQESFPAQFKGINSSAFYDSLLRPQLHCTKEAWVTQWSYEPCCAGPPQMDRSEWRVLTKYGPLEKETATHSSILAWRTPWTVQKGISYIPTQITSHSYSEDVLFHFQTYKAKLVQNECQLHLPNKAEDGDHTWVCTLSNKKSRNRAVSPLIP